MQGIRDITARDFEAAALVDATIKPIVWSTRRGTAVEAFIGPALVPNSHPMAGLPGTLSGIQLSGRYVRDLFFSGPGAGPDITAATLMDDAVEAVSSVPRLPRPARPSGPLTLSSPATEWFVRLRFPGLVPDASAAAAILQRHGLEATRVTDAIGNARWLRLIPATRAEIDQAICVIARTHRIACHAIRAV